MQIATGFAMMLILVRAAQMMTQMVTGDVMSRSAAKTIRIPSVDRPFVGVKEVTMISTESVTTRIPVPMTWTTISIPMEYAVAQMYAPIIPMRTAARWKPTFVTMVSFAS